MTYNDAKLNKGNYPPVIIHEECIELKVVIAPHKPSDFRKYRSHVYRTGDFGDEISKMFSSDGEFCISAIGRLESDTFFKILQE